MTTSRSPTPICPTAATATRLPSPPRTIEGHHRHHNLRFSRKLDKGEGREEVVMCCLLFKSSLKRRKGSSPSSPTSLPSTFFPSFISYSTYGYHIPPFSHLHESETRGNEGFLFALLPPKPCLTFTIKQGGKRQGVVTTAISILTEGHP